MAYCGKEIVNRSKYKELAQKKCHKGAGHAGPCAEFPYLELLGREHPAVRSKIVRDSTMTTGAAWKSEDAGPNRILRWVMLLDDETLKQEYGLDMSKLKPGVVAKLREKAATYDDCMEVAAKLTWVAYQMAGAPVPDVATKQYLEKRFGPIQDGSTTCVVCKAPLSFELFKQAARGKAEIETAHKNPRFHNADNVGFAHRACNIAQGNKTLSEFYEWIKGIISRAEAGS